MIIVGIPPPIFYPPTPLFLCVMILGTFEGSAERVWVLDPVDGTKGFMRGEHYCIALALLQKGELLFIFL